MLSIPAIPTTTVQKITGAITILMRFTNACPTGSIASPVAGKKYPTAMPRTIPTSTQK
jgi:hypothetical protein